ncbi:hypothetical protein A2318_00585 [Candidatus Uhrbacteria bacterium RIFOXYB2_FULL_45_11]|uniref:HNH nuclease domain-containing protein n=1 Tax=Candidatus Uhrbacteria bacterium RIFOXYB2_FULL_45_11 TaxID=1802421 RepID=A0A1F7W711_9BACT|nr:MAG: hypothetical protein A2318_00585 [Candidatus Uhrbacteria bacterium RIFOXYB2_FULL_45_11]
MKEKRTYADRAESNKRAVANRRRKVREMAVAQLGGKCRLCGYNRCAQALDIHHLDPKKKNFGISASGYTRSWKAIQDEIALCILICANCHREMHAGVTQLPIEISE